MDTIWPWIVFYLLTYVKALIALMGIFLFLRPTVPASDTGQFFRELLLTSGNLMLWSLAPVGIFALNRWLGFPKMVDPVMAVPKEPGGSEVPWAYIPLWFAFMLLAVDLCFYWTHRFMHDRWPSAHRIHHQFTAPTAGSAYSFDIREGFILTVTTAFIPYLILPISMYTAVTFNLFAAAWAAFLHSGFDSSGWSHHPILKYVYGPSHHRHHHATGTDNFGLYFVFWDRFFGTERAPAPVESQRS